MLGIDWAAGLGWNCKGKVKLMFLYVQLDTVTIANHTESPRFYVWDGK